MQTPQKSFSKNGSLQVPKKTSPITPRSSRSHQTNKTGSESESTTPKYSGAKASVSKSPKVTDHKSPRSSVSEKKRPSKIAELESQVTQLQEDLKKAKDQLASSESSKKQAEKEAEEANNQFKSVTAKLEDTDRRLRELSESEDACIEELRKVGQYRDKEWQSELETVQKQQSADSAALFSAMSEIQLLKLQLEKATNSEASQAKKTELANYQLHAMEQSTEETLSFIEGLRVQLKEYEKSEEENQMSVTETQLHLEISKATIDALRSESRKALESFNSMASELEHSKAQVIALEELVKKLQGDGQVMNAMSCGGVDESSLRAQVVSLHSEIEQLKCALEASEVRNQEEHIKHTMQTQAAFEEAERIKLESDLRQSKLESVLKETSGEVARLKADLIKKETELTSKHDQNNLAPSSETNKGGDNGSETNLNSKLSNVMADVADLRRKLAEKEIKLQNVMGENEILKLEVEQIETEKIRSVEAVNAELEVARTAEQEALVSIRIAREESDKSARRVARVTEQLDAAQANNSEMEAELRKLRIQTEQWRKAAEAAASILTTGNNGRLVERSGSMDASYDSLAGKLLNSPFSDDLDDDSPKKKKKNMLKKIGVLWKKNQK